MTMPSDDRPKVTGWAVDLTNHVVAQVEALDNGNGTYMVPKIGTVSNGHSFFLDEEKAKDALRTVLRRKIGQLQEALSALD